MTEWIDRLGDPWSIIIGLAAFLIISNWLWINALYPLWKATKGFVEQRQRQNKLNEFADHWQTPEEVALDADRWETLRTIADAFKPNGKLSLVDEVRGAAADRKAIKARLEEIENKIDEFIIARKNGGHRWNDPHIEPDDDT